MKSAISHLKSAIARLWPYLFVALICLPAAYPYLGGGIPRSNDSLTHLYRAAELDRLVRSGDIFPRWAPDFAHGYGYPIFNYFAYFSHYLIVLFHFAGLSFLSALRASYITALLASGLTAFLLGRDLADDDAAGWMAAAAYVYSPYLLYTAHVRGGLPENLALAFFPLALWAVRRALKIHHEGAYTLIAAIAIAGFIFSHIGMAIQYLPLLALFGLYTLAACLLDSGDWRNPRRWLFGVWSLGFAVLLGLGLLAFIWLPALAELQFVQFQTAFARAGLVYRENFFQWRELFAYPRIPVYADVFNPPVIRSLSIPAVAVALLGWLRWRSMPRAARLDYTFFFVMLAGCAFLILDTSKPIWDAIGLLQRSTFPWRFLGPASLFAAVLGGMVVGDWRLEVGGWKLEVRGWKFEVGSLKLASVHCSLLIVSLFIAYSLPFLFVPREPAPENPALADIARFEIPPLLVGTTTTGEYTPVWVKEFPDTREMQNALLEGRGPERLDAPGAAVEHISARPAHDTYRITAPQPITVTYRSFYFPGWRATIDGGPIPIRVADPHGLMSLDIPPGEHTLEIRFGSTPVRAIAGTVSLISLLVLAVGSWQLAVGSWNRVRLANSRPPAAASQSPFGVWSLMFVVCSLFIASLFIRKDGAPPAQHLLNMDFGDELTLIGYDIHHSSFNIHHSEITIVWQAQHPIGVPYGMNVRLADDRGLIWSDTNIERPRDWRFFPGTDFWPADKFILDSYLLKPVRGAPPGSYHLEAIVYRADTLQALSVQRIGEFVVERPTNEPASTPLASFDGIALIAAEADRTAAAPGDPYRLTLRWQAAANSPPDRSLALELVDAAGNVALTRAESIAPQYPPSRWKQGDVLTQYVFFRLPAGLPDGGFHWRIGGVDLSGVTAPSLSVAAPDRSFEIPPLAHEINADIGAAITLLGYSARAEGSTITVDLVWQANSELGESYRVFLHLLDADGSLVSQSDGEPANWTRPTTGWLAGEVVIDTRILTAPGSGKYTLMAGMVDEAGERLAAEGWPEGRINLGQVIAP